MRTAHKIIKRLERHFDEGEISQNINRIKFMRCLVPRHDDSTNKRIINSTT